MWVFYVFALAFRVALVHVPDEWVPRKSGYDNIDEFNYEVSGPIKQHFKQVSRTLFTP